MLKKYNVETIEAINNFIDDFMGIFPGLLSKEELLNRINNNMHHNISFNMELEENIAGQYTNNAILISKDVTDVRKVLFHEFIHVITNCKFIREFKYHNFIEGLTTLAEEMYVDYKKIDKKKRRHVNGYIPTFVRQLNFVKDGKLLEEFLVNPSDIYKMFYPEVMKFDCPIGHGDKDFRVFFERIARKNESIVYMANAKCTDDIINGNISDLETDILKQYHIGVHLGVNKFDSKKLLELYNMQLQPNLSDYLEVLHFLKGEGKISDNDILECGKIGLFYLLSSSGEFDISNLNIDEEELNDSELNYIASKIFGFYDILYNHGNLLNDFDTDDVEESLDKLFELQSEYEERLPIYRDLVREAIRGNLDLDSVKNSKLRRSENPKESSRMSDYLLDKPKGHIDLLEAVFGFLKYNPTFILEGNDGVDLVYNSDLFYYPIDIVSLEEMIEKSNVIHKNNLINVFRNFSDQQILVCSEFEFDLEYFIEYPFKIYLYDGSFLNRVGFQNKGESVECNFKQISFIEEGRSLFEKDTLEKFKIKSE